MSITIDEIWTLPKNEWEIALKNQSREYLEKFLNQKILNKKEISLLILAVDHLEQRTQDRLLKTYIHFPYLVLSDFSNETSNLALDLILITYFMETGIRLLDDFSDKELNINLQKLSPSVIFLMSTSLLFTFPQLIISDLNISPEKKVALLKKVSNYYLSINSGQLVDLDSEKHQFTIEESIECMKNKTGQWRTLYVELALILGDANENQKMNYIEFTEHFGLLKQIANDYSDLFISKDYIDLKNGIMSFPIVAYLDTLAPEEKPDFISQLEKARIQNTGYSEIADKIEPFSNDFCLRLIMYYAETAKSSLEKAAKNDFSRVNLQRMINDVCEV
jgi:geranylgeranyl pyrophosphate synthase